MVLSEIGARRGSFLAAYEHFRRRAPDDFVEALEHVRQLVQLRDSTEADEEIRRLEFLAQHLVGLRERLDAATVDVAVELRARGVHVNRIARWLGTPRATLQTWYRKLDDANT